MSLLQLVFLIVSAVGLLSALGTVLARNLVHAALFLVAFFFAVACQFVLLEAEFLAAMQVLVYIGAVTILLLFGVMLTRNIQGDETTGGHWAWKLPAAIVSLGVLGVLAFGITADRGRPGESPWGEAGRRPGGVNPTVGGPASVAMAGAPDGRLVASADRDGRVRVWDPSGRQVAAFPTGDRPVSAVGFSADGTLVVAADDRGGVTAWDVRSRRPVFERLGGRPGRIASIAVGPRRSGDDGDRLVAASGRDGVVRLWDGDGAEAREVAAHDGPVLASGVTADGRLVTAGADRLVKTWTTDDLSPAPVVAAPAGRPVAALAVGIGPSTGEGSAVAPPVAVASLISGEPGRWDLRVLDAADGAEVAAFEGLIGVPIAVALTPDSRRVAVLVGPASLATGVSGDGDEAGVSVRVWEIGAGGGPGGPVEVAVDVPVGVDASLAAGSGALRVALASGAGPIVFRDGRDGGWSPATSPAATASVAISDMPRAVGDELMTRYVLPFEIAGLMLTAALVGAIVLARQDAPAESAAPGRPASAATTPPRAPEPARPSAVPEIPDARPTR